MKKRRVDFSHVKGRVVFEGLTVKEVEKMLGALVDGSTYITTNPKSGRYAIVSKHTPLPPPSYDQGLAPFWVSDESRPQPVQLSLIQFHDACIQRHQKSISVYVHGLKTNGPKEYTRYAKILRNAGFLCLRSQRNSEGRVKEIWYLESMSALRGAYRECFVDCEGGVRLETISIFMLISRLIKDISFEKAEVTLTRYA